MGRNNRRNEEEPGLSALALAVVVAHPRQSVGICMGVAAVCAIMSNALFLQNGQHPAPLFAGKTKTVTITQDPVAMPRPRVIDMAPSNVLSPQSFGPAATPSAAPAPAPVAAAPRNRADIITDLQRALSRKGFYDGAVDGVWGSRTDVALRDFLQAANVKMTAEASEDVLRVVTQTHIAKNATTGMRSDPIADMLSTSREAPAAQAVAPVQPPAPIQSAAPAATGSRRLAAVQRALSEFGYGQVKATGTMGPETQAAIERFERERRLPVTGQLSERVMRELATMTGRAID